MDTPVRTTINLGPELRKKLVALAAANERSVAAEARMAIAYYVDAHQIQPRSKR
jgi:predicted transcriptional regulator